MTTTVIVTAVGCFHAGVPGPAGEPGTVLIKAPAKWELIRLEIRVLGGIHSGPVQSASLGAVGMLIELWSKPQSGFSGSEH